VGEAWQVLVANAGAFGGGNQLDAADPADAQLDLAIVPRGTRAALAWRAWGMRHGDLTRQRAVVHRRVREAVIATGRPVTWVVDGEQLDARTQARVRIEPAAVALVVGS
jgi:diacylglycerol kinase family enzyme